MMRRGQFMNLALVSLLAVVFTLSGCGDSPTPFDDPSVQEIFPTLEESASNSALSFDAQKCTPLPTEGLPGGSFTIALLDDVRPDLAPVPGNPSERMAFSQLYETLVNVGCDGSLKPGLSDHWVSTDDGSTWVFRIREGAVMWDGTRVTASVVKKAWIRNQKLTPAQDHVSPWAWLNAHSKSVKILDGERLAIQLPEAQLDFPLLLAHPATAVAISRPGWIWPVGSGPGRLQASTPAPLPDLIISPNIHHPQAPIWKSLSFLVKPGLDARDLIVLDPDLLVVDDNVSADFFRGAAGFRVSNLPWQRLYLLVCSPKQNPTGSHRWLKPAAHFDSTDDLSGIATRAWTHLIYPVTRSLNCPQLTGPITNSFMPASNSTETFIWPDKNTLLFYEDDPGSRELALRLAALGDKDIKALGTSLYQMNLALEHQSPGAFILAMDRHYPSGCLQLASLLGRATWLQQAATSDLPSDLGKTSLQGNVPVDCALTQSGIITPLLLTHSYLVHKENLAGVELEYDGTLNLGKLGRTQ